MRLAVFADVHADAAALRDALARIDALGCDRIVCAGDLVDYGTATDATLALLRERGIPCIRGNHDRWAAGPSAASRSWDVMPDSLGFLRSLPDGWDAELEGVRVAVRHGTPRSDMRGIYPRFTPPGELRSHLDDVGAEVLVVGHTHIPFRIEVGGRLVVNPGALLREPGPKMAGRRLLFDPEARRFVSGPGRAGGTFGVLDLPSREFRVYRAADGSASPLAEWSSERC